MRIFKKSFLVLLSVFLLVTACKSTSDIQVNQQNTDIQFDKSVKQGTLSNGMTYLVKENHEPQNRIMLRLVVKAGSVMEEEDQKGVAHFVEHLAFNGTKNFAKSAIVDYFEKIGMSFGPEVNAYTSFEETVYMLEIPADDPQMLKTSLLVLHDWASEISFDPVEVDKERGVVTEEWRLSQGLNRRITEKQIPFLFKDSKFADRLPIGDMKVISSISRQRIIDFYKKWYRPEFMSVILVGDAKVDVLEKEIKEIMGTIPASEQPLEHPEFPLPVQTEKNICIVKDQEQKYPVVNILFRNENYAPAKDYNDIKNKVAIQIANTCFNQRLQEITNGSGSTWLDAAAGEYTALNHHSFNYLGLIPKENQFEQALKALFDEYDRICNHGITQEEYDRVKALLTSQNELNLKNKDKMPSSQIASNLVSYVLTGDIPTSPDYEYVIIKQILNELTLEELDYAFKSNFQDRGTLMFIVAPSSAKDIPSEKELYKTWENYKNSEIVKYSDEKTRDTLMDKPLKRGKVASRRDLKELGSTEVILENGVRIIMKKTDFEKDVIYMSAVSMGGKNYVSEEEFPSSNAAIDYAVLSGYPGFSYNQLQKFLAPKNISYRGYLTENSEKLMATSTNADLEVLFQMANLMFTQPQFTDEGWSLINQYYKQGAQTHGQSPNDVFVDKILELAFGNSIRHAPFDLNFFNKMNPKTAEKIYRERFANPADFTFIFVGDYNEWKLLDLCCLYLGTMKTTDKKETMNIIPTDFPKGIKEATVYKGQDDQGQADILFSGKLPAAKSKEEYYLDEEMFNQLKALLEIRLRELIREEKGGSYGVGVYGSILGNEKGREFELEIYFGCKPDREEELKQEVLKEIKRLQSEEVSAEYIEKLTESYRRTRETSLRDNNFYLEKLNDAYVFDIIPENFLKMEEKVISNTTPSELKKLAKKYINTENYVCVFLKPETR